MVSAVQVVHRDGTIPERVPLTNTIAGPTKPSTITTVRTVELREVSAYALSAENTDQRKVRFQRKSAYDRGINGSTCDGGQKYDVQGHLEYRDYRTTICQGLAGQCDDYVSCIEEERTPVEEATP